MKKELQDMAANAISAIKSQSHKVVEFGGVPMVNTDLAVTAVNELKAMIDGMPEDAPASSPEYKYQEPESGYNSMTVAECASTAKLINSILDAKVPEENFYRDAPEDGLGAKAPVEE